MSPLPITTKIDGRRAPHCQSDDAVRLFAVADAAQVLAPGCLLGVAEQVRPGDMMMVAELGPAQAGEVRFRAVGAGTGYADQNRNNAPIRGREMSETHRITVDPGQCGGRPCLRIRVRDVLDLLAAGADRAEILADYPLLEVVIIAIGRGTPQLLYEPLILLTFFGLEKV